MVARRGGGYGGFTDRYIDIRVDDHPDPLAELDRLLDIAEVNGLWNLAWTAFTQQRQQEALPLMERTAGAARAVNSEVLPEVLYDLAAVRAAGGLLEEALQALEEAIAANPGLAAGAREDPDLAPLRTLPAFRALVNPPAAGQGDPPLCLPSAEDPGQEAGGGHGPSAAGTSPAGSGTAA